MLLPRVAGHAGIRDAESDGHDMIIRKGGGRRGPGSAGGHGFIGRGTMNRVLAARAARKAQVYADAQLRDKDDRHGLIVAKGPR